VVQSALAHMAAAIALVSIVHMLAAITLRSKHGGGTEMGQKFLLAVGVWWLVNCQGDVIMMVSLSLWSVLTSMSWDGGGTTKG